MDPSGHLFRREAGRMVAALTRVFGLHNLELAEDVVQDAFCRALEVWKFNGLPDNPPAWLMKTARNRALDVLRRERTARTFAPEYGRLLHTEWTMANAVREAFDLTDVRDDRLRMMFSCCHGGLPEATQVMLVLALVGGFGAREIAAAFVSSRTAIEKRLSRAKQVLKSDGVFFEIADRADFAARLPVVQRALYLIFNEGYHSASVAAVVRSDLCHEAIRLAHLLAEHPLGERSTQALLALMYLGAARLPARLDPSGQLTALYDQNRSLWNRPLIERGVELLERSAQGPSMSRYHLEAAIAAEHALARSFDETNWNAIVSLYDTLLRLVPSAVVALNRAIALGHRDGPESGLAAIEAIADRERLAGYPFYHAALGEFEARRGNGARARACFDAAIAVARNAEERQFLQNRARASNPLAERR